MPTSLQGAAIAGQINLAHLLFEEHGRLDIAGAELHGSKASCFAELEGRGIVIVVLA